MSILILSKFKMNVLALVDELIIQFREESDFVVLRLFIDNQMPIIDLISKFKRFIDKNDNQVRNLIKNKNSFALENDDSLFSFMKKDSQIKKYKSLWLSSEFTEDSKDVVWQYLQVFVKLCDKYYCKDDIT